MNLAPLSSAEAAELRRGLRRVMLLIGSWWLTSVALHRSLRKVQGDSMLPTLWPGDFVLVAPVPPVRLKAGDLVVVQHPDNPDLLTVKRVELVNQNGVRVLGDNPHHSTDSRTWGAIDKRLVRSRVIRVVWRSSEVRRASFDEGIRRTTER